MHHQRRTPPFVRSFAFRRLSAFAVLWYFLLILLAASTTMDIGVQLALLITAFAVELLFGSPNQVRRNLGWMCATAGIIAASTVLFDRYGSARLFRWGWFAPTWDGLWTGIFLATAFITISLATLAQSRAFSRTQLSRSTNRVFPRLSLIIQLILGTIPRLNRQVRTLFSVERMNHARMNDASISCTGTDVAVSDVADDSDDRLTLRTLARRSSRRAWATRLRALAYALLAGALDDSAARTSAAGLAANVHPAESHQGLAMEQRAHPYRASASPSLAVRSFIFVASATVLYAIVEMHMPQITAPSYRFRLSALSNYCAAAALMLLPYLMEGGERLWAHARA